MKNHIPVILITLLIVLCLSVPVFAVQGGVSGGERNRFYIVGGAGFATGKAEGALIEAGIEVRLFGRFHARLMWDHYYGDNDERDSETLHYINGGSLYVLYKLPLSEIIDFNVKAGGNFTSIRSEITALGLTFTTTKSDIGFCGGAGLTFQLSNHVYLYTEVTVKHLMTDEPWTWVKGQAGFMVRLW